MYLSRVEMTGFKSFADKTIIEFDQGLTAVVGPNGSGKSNFTEAVRWVLGEQSIKSLRGNRMEDVIFNGTADRKPVNIAKVTVVLNNEDRYLDYDFSEISLTRSYNRNGDSFYYINQERVRLKDIVDLLLDSGLGKNSFSIISQGQVEQIFLSKPEERRVIFEEAAGVQKYQYRKQEAERKLVKSEDNLSRLKDIIYEIEQQLAPLESQRKNALKYLATAEQLKQWEVTLLTQQIEQSEQRTEELTKRLLEIQQEIDSHSQKDESLLASIQRIKQQMNEDETAVDAINLTQRRHWQEMEQYRSDERLLQRDLSYSIEQLELNLSSVQQNQTNLEVLAEQLKAAEAEKETKQQQCQEVQAQLDQVKERLEQFQSLSQHQSEDIREEILALFQDQAQAKNIVNQNQLTIERLTQRLPQVIDLIDAIQLEIDQIDSQKKNYESDAKRIEQQQSEIQSNQTDIDQQVTKLHWQQEQLTKQLQEAENIRYRKEQQYQHALDQQHNYAGYYGGVRAVMNERHVLTGIEGTVADLIRVAEQFDLAISTALGSSMQSIVVQDDRAARQAIQYLTQQKAGRATFLPRTNIKPKYVSKSHLAQIENQPGYIGIASELIHVEPANRIIAEHLLGGTVIANSLKEAQKLAQSTRHQVKIVTLDGDVLMPGGSVTGGKSQRQSESMLSRQNQIDKLAKELAGLEENVVKLNQQKHTLSKKYQQSMTQQSEYQLKNRQIVEQSNEVHRLIKEQETMLLQKQNQLAIQQDLRQDIEEELVTYQEEVTKAQGQLEQVEQTLESQQALLKQLQFDEGEKQAHLKQLNQQSQSLHTKLAVLEVEVKQLVERIKTMELQQAEGHANKEESVKQQQVHRNQQSDYAEQIKQLQTKIQQLDALLKEDEQQLEKHKQQKVDQQAQLETLEVEREEVVKIQQKMFQEQVQVETQIEQHQTTIDQHLNHLNEEYQLTYEMAKELIEKQVVNIPEDLSDQVKRLRQQIHRLGPINLQAIDDWDELSARYNNLTHQRDDLLMAMEQLTQTMQEMDHEVVTRFAQSFEEIDRQFQKTFQKLFAGGHASLQLTQPDDLLTTGVDIIAQPPGKKKQSLALLSGGERALTAIALLFAILEVKPVPFVILDEVEAALDDANVVRYGSYIREFTHDTQFIVVTHRQGTMESADRLYGVTMEKSGVSKLATVTLDHRDSE